MDLDLLGILIIFMIACIPTVIANFLKSDWDDEDGD